MQATAPKPEPNADSASPGPRPVDDSMPDTPDRLEDLFRDHADSAFHAAYRVTGNPADAEDAIQTVFLRLARREEAIELGDGAGPYLRRAAVNAALDVVRGRRDESPVTGDGEVGPTPIDTAPDPERNQRSRDSGRLLREALTRVTPRSAEIFALRYFEGMANKDIAELLGSSPTAIAVTLHRVRASLREDLASHLGATP